MLKKYKVKYTIDFNGRCSGVNCFELNSLSQLYLYALEFRLIPKSNHLPKRRILDAQD